MSYLESTAMLSSFLIEMKKKISTMDQCRFVIDQINRAMQCAVPLNGFQTNSMGYCLNGRAIVTFTVTRSLKALIVKLIDPNPEYAECGDPRQNIFRIDLTGDVFVDDDILEAIAEHLIDHRDRLQNPCEAHPSERCSDCHLREQPCMGGESVIMDKVDTSQIHFPSELYAEIVEILTSWGFACEYAGAINSQWGWMGTTSLSIRQVHDHVDVVFEDWVIEKLLYEAGTRYACPTISYIERGAFGLLCAQMVSAFPEHNPAAVHAEMSIPHGNC